MIRAGWGTSRSLPSTRRGVPWADGLFIHMWHTYYMCICIYVCVYTYIYIYIYKLRCQWAERALGSSRLIRDGPEPGVEDTTTTAAATTTTDNTVNNRNDDNNDINNDHTIITTNNNHDNTNHNTTERRGRCGGGCGAERLGDLRVRWPALSGSSSADLPSPARWPGEGPPLKRVRPPFPVEGGGHIITETV